MSGWTESGWAKPALYVFGAFYWAMSMVGIQVVFEDLLPGSDENRRALASLLTIGLGLIGFGVWLAYLHQWIETRHSGKA